MNEPADLVRRYLRDHDAAAAGGASLARRCARSNGDNSLGRYLDHQFLPEIRADRQLVEAWIGAYDAEPSRVRRAATRVATSIGRAKLNGRILTYSPLSRVYELEALIAGVHAKHRMWVALGLLVDTSAGTPLPDVTEARERAERQLSALEQHHRDAATTAFAPTRRRRDHEGSHLARTT